MVHKALLGLPVLLAPKDHRDLLVSPDSLVRQAHKALRGLLVLPVPLVLLAPKDHRGLPVSLELRGR